MTIHRNIGIAPTVEEMAAEFESLDDRQKAKFFNLVRTRIDNWGNPQFLACYLGDAMNEVVTPGAKEMLRDIVAFMDNKLEDAS